MKSKEKDPIAFKTYEEYKHKYFSKTDFLIEEIDPKKIGAIMAKDSLDKYRHVLIKQTK